MFLVGSGLSGFVLVGSGLSGFVLVDSGLFLVFFFPFGCLSAVLGCCLSCVWSVGVWFCVVGSCFWWWFCVVRLCVSVWYVFLVCSVRVLVSVSLVFLRRVFLWFGFFLCARGLGKRCGLVVWWVVGGQLCRHGGCGVCFVE